MTIERPLPPRELLDAELGFGAFVPAPDVAEWIQSALVDEGGPIHNPDHAHLAPAELGVLWTIAPARRHMRNIAGTAEIVQLRGHPWVKARQEWQMEQWFGRVPELLITLSADYANAVDDATWCALVDHECYHLAHALKDGFPMFRKDGRPKYAMKGHDVEQFVGVVRRWGADPAGVRELVQAASKPPEISAAALAWACGSCSARAA